MVLKLRDLFNQKVNKTNNQISLDVRKKLLKKCDMDINDILNMPVLNKEKLFDSK